jgi:hypothetical protein
MSSLQYPKDETLELRTLISFYDYKRPTPGNPPEISSVEGGTSLISLPLPLAIPDSYGVILDSVDFGLINTDFSAAGQDFVTKVGEGRGFGEKLFGALATAAALSPGLSDTKIGRQAQSQTGLVRNPHTTAIFNGVTPRSHSFSFRLSPKNRAESDVVTSIFETIRNNMLPDEAFGGFALNYPRIVTMSFEGVNKSITPVFFSFISDVRMDYTGGGGASFYKGGNPIDMTLQINLKEINIVTRNTFTGVVSTGNANDAFRAGERTVADAQASAISGSNAGPAPGAGV